MAIGIDLIMVGIDHGADGITTTECTDHGAAIMAVTGVAIGEEAIMAGITDHIQVLEVRINRIDLLVEIILI